MTRDIVLQKTNSGTSFANIGLAINSSYVDKSSGQKKEETVFLDIVAWSKTAELAAEYLSKGKPALFECRLKNENWTDKQTGDKRSKLSLVCENMQFLGGKDSGSEPRRPAPTQDRASDFNPNDAFPVGTDEVPF